MLRIVLATALLAIPLSAAPPALAGEDPADYEIQHDLNRTPPHVFIKVRVETWYVCVATKPEAPFVVVGC